jgi:hypothetical protein
MIKTVFTLLFILALGLSGGCEFANNPLLVDGAFVNAAFRVDQEGLPANFPFGISSTVHLNDILDNVDGIADSIKIYNITVKIDSVTGSTPPTAAISSTTRLDGNTLFSINNVLLSNLSTERSIFDNSLPGFSFSSSGVQYLISKLRENPPPDVNVAVSGSSNSSSLHFTLKVKFYTQVYTSP